MALSDQGESSEPSGPNVSFTGAFEDVYRQHAQAVYRYALKCVGRKDLAEDLVSEAFLALADGQLTTDEIYGLDLDASLIVLSACRSGGGVMTSDGIAS